MAQERSLIINADGYGFTPGVNQGILETFEARLVTSTSCTPNFGHLQDAGQVQARFPEISFGIHFNLNVGHPCAPAYKVPSLIGEDGRFHGAELGNKLLQRKIRAEEIEIELEAQAAMLTDQGVRISHWDGHQNKHLWPGYFEAAMRVAKRFAIPAIRSHRRELYSRTGPVPSPQLRRYYRQNPKRILTHAGGRLRTAQAERNGFAAADRLITPGYADDSHKSMGSFWQTLGQTLKPGFSEVYCHPGYPDELLRNNSKYVEPRADEVRVLTDPLLREHFAERRIRLVNFWDLTNERNP